VNVTLEKNNMGYAKPGCLRHGRHEKPDIVLQELRDTFLSVQTRSSFYSAMAISLTPAHRRWPRPLGCTVYPTLPLLIIMGDVITHFIADKRRIPCRVPIGWT